MQSFTLDQKSLAEGVAYLCSIDQDLAGIYSRLGLPPLWGREPGFPTLVRIILEQQVSLASARAAFQKLEATLGRVTPENFLRLDDDELKKIGFSRQKAGYCRLLALGIHSQEIDLQALSSLDDASARLALIRIKGIGPWTAEIYLTMVLLRSDAWPAGDMALAAALQKLKGLPARPAPEQMVELAEPWRPWRAVAARLLWHYYLQVLHLSES